MEGKKSEFDDDGSEFMTEDSSSEPQTHKTHHAEFHHSGSAGQSSSSESHHHEHHEHHDHSGAQLKNKFKKMDFWKIATAVLVGLLLISLFTDWFEFNSELSSQEASEKALEFINKNLLQGQAVAQVKSIEESSGLYAVTLDVMGQEYNSYVSKDGNFFFPQAVDMTQPLAAAEGSEGTPQDLVKSDKPKVELFVMSHCPYGTQAEKGILPVVEKLGDKIDFELKFVYYAMHGKTEMDEETRQVCIMNEQADKFNTYLACFLEDGDAERCLTANAIDTAKLDLCIEKLDAQYGITVAFENQSSWLNGKHPLFNVFKEDNQKYNVGGSPTLVINGQQVSSGRSPATYLATICGAFNQAPAECQEELSTSQYSSGFGYDTTAAGVAASCGS